MEKVILGLAIAAMGAVVLLVGIGFEQMVRFGVREGIVKRSSVGEEVDE